jgi:hypothetical protein
MTDNKYFSFTTFKSVMEVTDIDETTYSFILHSVFRYVKQKYGIDLEATVTYIPNIGSTVNSIIVPLDNTITINQLVNDETTITSVTNNLTTTTFSVSPNFSVLPSEVIINTTLIPFDLQYAIYQHTKFLFESQKRNTSILELVSDSAGNKTRYKTTIPTFISSMYNEYSPNEIAFL